MASGQRLFTFEQDVDKQLSFPSESHLSVALDVPWSRIQQLVQESDSMLHSTSSLMNQTPDCSMDNCGIEACPNCDGKIQDLKQKLTEAQKQLTVAISSNYTKNVMIEQLDKTLSKIVEGWKKLETDKATQILKIENERNNAKSELKKEQEVLIKMEHELTLTLDKLVCSQKEIEEVHREKEAWVAERENKIKNLSEELIVERSKTSNILATHKALSEEYEKNFKEMNNRLTTERQEWSLTEDKCKTQIKALQAELNGMREEHIQTEQMYKTKNIQVEMLTNQLEDVLREKESLKVEVNILNARNSAEKIEMENKLREALELQMKAHDKDLENLRTKLRSEHEVHCKQLELNFQGSMEEMLQKKKNEETKDRRKLEMELEETLKEQAERLKYHLKLKDAEFEQQQNNREEKMREMMDEIVQLKKENANLSSSRSQLMARIQDLLQSQWEESLRILYGTTEPSLKLNLSSVPQQSFLSRDILSRELDYLPSCEITKPSVFMEQRLHHCNNDVRKSSSHSNLNNFFKRNTFSSAMDHKKILNQRLSFQSLPDKPKVDHLSSSQSWPLCTKSKFTVPSSHYGLMEDVTNCVGDNNTLSNDAAKQTTDSALAKSFKKKLEDISRIRCKSTSPLPSEVMSDSTGYLRPMAKRPTSGDTAHRNSSSPVMVVRKTHSLCERIESPEEDISKMSESTVASLNEINENKNDTEDVQSCSPVNNVESKTVRHEERQEALKKYLEKLLQRPPGVPLDVNDELWPCKDVGNTKKMSSCDLRQKQAQANCRQWIQSSRSGLN